MVVSKIDKLLTATQEVTQYPPEVISSVINHMFTHTRDFLEKPTAPGLRLPHLGVFRSTYRITNHYIKDTLIPKLRKNKTPELIEQFKIFWKYRDLIRQDEARREYKKVYGNWHYKKKDGKD